MNLKKSLTSMLLVGGMVVGGAGVAAAQYGDAEPAEDVAVEEVTEDVTAEDVDVNDDAIDGATLLQVQDDADTDDADDSEDGERDRSRCSGKHAAAAEAIGIDVEDLQAELEAGATIAEVAEANGVATQDVIDAMVANAAERLDAKV